MNLLRKPRLLAALGLAAVILLAVAGTLGPRASASRDEIRLRLLDEPRPAPDLSFAGGHGQPLRLADFQGRTVLLNIWATWCAPCRKEMPALDRLQATLGGPDFEVIALSIDEGGRADVEPFYAELGLEHLGIYVDPSGATTRSLRVVGVPTTVLIDPMGREIARALGPDAWDAPAMVRFLEEQIGTARP